MAHSDYFMNKYLAFIFLSAEQVSGLPNHKASPFPFSTKVNCWDSYIPWGPGKGDIGMDQERERGMSKEMGLVCPYGFPPAAGCIILSLTFLLLAQGQV